jgi:hypothetical protein
MQILNGIVNVHKRSLESLIHGSELFLTIRLMPPRVTAGVNLLYGDSSRESSKLGETKGPYKCLWYDALSARSFSDSGIETTIEKLAGQYKEADSFAELWLQDILVTPDDYFGETWFDKAQIVVFNNKRFKYLGAAKLGLAITAPYIVMVALKGSVGYVD